MISLRVAYCAGNDNCLIYLEMPHGLGYDGITIPDGRIDDSDEMRMLMKFSEMPYERVDFEVLQQEFADLMRDFDAAKNGQEQFAVHERYYRILSRVRSMITIAQIRHDGNTVDPFYKAEQDFYDAHTPVLQNLVVAYQKKLCAARFRPELERRIGKVAFTNMEIAAKAMDERLVPLMQEENTLVTTYENLLASAKIDWNGEQLNLSLMNPYLHNADRAVRAKAWEKYAAFFAANAEQLDDLYDRLVHNRTRQARMMGYEDYLTLGYYRMNRNCYDRKMVAEFRRQIKRDIVPFAEKIQDRRRGRLGLSALSYIDQGVFSGSGNPKPIGTPQEILEAGRKMYQELSPETGKFMNFMCDNELFDVFGRKDKRTGGYMTYIPDYKAPFIFANFNGTSSDTDVITHECGHAFQGFVVADDPILEHQDITMETAETHSMSMEFFTEPWMKLFFGEHAQEYIDMHFEDALLFLPYGTIVDEFQHIAYENPNLTPKERNSAWRELEREYMPHLHYDGCDYLENGGYWQHQHHIYSLPLYYIDYVIAQADALQYKAWMDRDYKEAWDSYLTLCRLSASDYFTGLLKTAGLRNPFEDGCLKAVVEQLEKSGKF